jgi:hypothetical protein
MAEYLETHARRIYGATDTIDIIAAEAILAHIRRSACRFIGQARGEARRVAL